MRTRWRAVFVLAGFSTSVLGGCSSDKAGAFPDEPGADATAEAAQDAGNEAEVVDPKYATIADTVEKERVKQGVPGVAVAVIEGGKVAWSAGFGSKDPDKTDPVKDTTLFRIGSVTKMLTAAGLLQLVEKGDIDLKSPITTYLPTLQFKKDASWAPSITVESLLTHTSGIVDYLEIDSVHRSDDALQAYLLGSFAQDQYLMAPPGSFYNYSNPGYMFAGLVTEKVAGTPYRVNLHDKLLVPLGMNRTVFLPADVLADGDYALGKTVNWNTGSPIVAHPDTYDNGWARPAGYAWSSVFDLAKFIEFLVKGNTAVLSDSLRNEITSRKVDTQEYLDRAWYGYGVQHTKGVFLGSQTAFYEIDLLAHGGAIPGFSSEWYYVPQCDVGFIALANTDGVSFVNSLVTTLLQRCALPATSTPPIIAEDPAKYDDYAGDYMDPFNVGEMKLSRVGKNLEISMPAVDAAKVPYDKVLVPGMPRNFLLTIQGTRLPLTIILDATGKGEYVRTRPFVARRVSTNNAAPPFFTVNANSLLASLRALPLPTVGLPFLVTGD